MHFCAFSWSYINFLLNFYLPYRYACVLLKFDSFTTLTILFAKCFVPKTNFDIFFFSPQSLTISWNLHGNMKHYHPFKKYVESEMFFMSVCCPSVMFEWSQLQLSCKFTTVGIQAGWIKTKMSKMNVLITQVYDCLYWLF